MFFTVDDDSEVAIAPRFSGTDVLKKFRWLIEDLEAKKLYFWGKRGPTEIQIFCQNFRILFFLSRIESKLQHWCFWVRSTPTSANILFYGKNSLSHSLSPPLSLTLSHSLSLFLPLSLTIHLKHLSARRGRITFWELNAPGYFPPFSRRCRWRTQKFILSLFLPLSLALSLKHSLTHSLTHNLTYFCWVYSIGLRAMNGSWREPDSWKLTRSGVRKTLSLRHPTPLSLSHPSLSHTLSLSCSLPCVPRLQLPKVREWGKWEREWESVKEKETPAHISKRRKL